MSKWLDHYLTYTEKTESPKIYHQWVALSVISSALQRRVWLPFGHSPIYPNLYVILLGPSGVGKSQAITIGSSFVSEIKRIQLIPESITREGFIVFMERSKTEFLDLKGKLQVQNAACCFSEELGVFIKEGETQFLTDLTDLYDCHPRGWRYFTIKREFNTLHNSCLTLLGGTTQSDLDIIIPRKKAKSGFPGRCLFIIADEGDKKDYDIPKFGNEEDRLSLLLRKDLQRISLLTGAFELSNGAEKVFKTIKKGQIKNLGSRLLGYQDRRGIHLLKLAMILSAGENSRKIISINNIEKADKFLLVIEKEMKNVFTGIGKERFGQLANDIEKFIREKGRTTKKQVLRKFQSELDITTMNGIENLLRESGYINVTVSNSETLYEAMADLEKEM